MPRGHCSPQRYLFSASPEVTDADRVVPTPALGTTLRLEIATTMSDRSMTTRLVGMLAHDLRTPLSSVMLLLELLEGAEGLTPEEGDDVRHALASARSLSEMLAVAVDTLRLAEGALAPEVDEHDLGEICRDAIGRVRARGAQAEIRLEGEAAISVRCDANLTSRAVAQLVSAADVVTAPGRAVRVRLSAADSTARVEVIDEGATIPDELREALFDEEGAVEIRARQRPYSRGLGTVFGRRVAEAHGGRAGVAVPPDAAAGRGNTVWIELPLGNKHRRS